MTSDAISDDVRVRAAHARVVLPLLRRCCLAALLCYGCCARTAARLRERTGAARHGQEIGIPAFGPFHEGGAEHCGRNPVEDPQSVIALDLVVGQANAALAHFHAPQVEQLALVFAP